MNKRGVCASVWVGGRCVCVCEYYNHINVCNLKTFNIYLKCICGNLQLKRELFWLNYKKCFVTGWVVLKKNIYDPNYITHSLRF